MINPDQIEQNKEYVNQLIKINKIDDETLKAYQNDLDNFINHHFTCSNKSKNCKQFINGYEQQLVFENGQFYQKLIPCLHTEILMETQKLYNRFLFTDYDPENKKTYLLFNNLKSQINFYNLDFAKKISEIQPYIHDKKEFEIKSQIVKRFLNEMEQNKTDKGLYLIGTLGVGKTNLMKFLALIAASSYQKTVVVTTVNNLVNKIKESFGELGVNTNKFLATLAAADFLVLDDMGSEQITKWVRDDVLFTLLNWRMENQKLTYFTSNLTINDLKKHYLSVKDDDPNKAIKTNRLIERIKALAGETKIFGSDHRFK